ncbi:MAG: FtsB family cell division protein [Flavobacteriales bacterium]
MKISKFLRNKYSITVFIFMGYVLFLDDMDVFTIISHLKKKNELSEQNKRITEELTKTKSTLLRLDSLTYYEEYARSKKFYKKENEDIFVIIPKD